LVRELSQQQSPPPLAPPHKGEGNRPRRVAPLCVNSSGALATSKMHQHRHPLTFLDVSMYMRAVGAAPCTAEVVMTDDSQEREAR
jgi:hypothetical protein